MRVLIINTSEKMGGAAIAAGRLVDALNNNGIKTTMLVRDKQTERLTVVPVSQSWVNLWKFLYERAVIWMANRFSTRNLFAVDIANRGIDITALPEFREADIIHLHWVNQGMLSLKQIRKIVDSGKPVVWTMHDMWPFTGICHYAGDCTRYLSECSHCPLLRGGGSAHDLSRLVFQKKLAYIADRKVTFVACSQWLEGLARKAALLQGQRVTNIPNAINTHLYRPMNRQEARTKCGLPQEKQLLLFGSMKITDERKGFRYLAEACRKLVELEPTLRERIGVVVVGKESAQLSEQIPFRVYSMDYVSDEKRLVEIYNAVDLYVTPSLQDNLPNTIVEAMACGIPCVGFQVGGIPQMIDHLHNGYVAEYRSADDLANGIRWALTEGGYAGLSEEARRKAVNSYSEERIARRYQELYNQVIKPDA
jgi:glycosyltransferase involved in cell wall biosynthesis